MQNKYMYICNLLDQIGPVSPRLDLIHKMIKSPDFIYRKEEHPEMMMKTLAESSYWLDQELLDESYLYQKEIQKLSPMQQAHLKMIDIGCLLMEKGFPLEYHTEDFTALGPNQLAPYVQIFVEQCHKRKSFLEKRPHKQKNKRPFISQKTFIPPLRVKG